MRPSCVQCLKFLKKDKLRKNLCTCYFMFSKRASSPWPQKLNSLWSFLFPVKSSHFWPLIIGIHYLRPDQNILIYMIIIISPSSTLRKEPNLSLKDLNTEICTVCLVFFSHPLLFLNWRNVSSSWPPLQHCNIEVNLRLVVLWYLQSFESTEFLCAIRSYFKSRIFPPVGVGKYFPWQGFWDMRSEHVARWQLVKINML